ncbi:hypothetical protein [Clostridium sp. BL-8]|uniref:hypothetical protein n=1 Tax=Clostridium sp. BL-8 TaxID=349938 RepID=UPI00098C4E37|nr:hypothetical protein [Clostridium sp. BL-8]OOM79947.1 hypothetical protein CLOBL_13150 [Clostridium sp. BL-8]
MSNVGVSSIINSIYSSITSSDQAKISPKLSEYLSDAKKDSEDLVKIINKLYKEAKSKTSTIMGVSFTSAELNSDPSLSSTTKVTSTFTKLFGKFIKAYNDFVDHTDSYDDKGLKNLKKNMTKIINDQSSGLSDIGVTIDDKGKLKLDEDKCNDAVSKGKLGEFINNNKGRKGFFYEIKKIAANLKSNNTYYLSDNLKKIIQSANNTTNNLNNINSSSQFDTYA